MLRSLIDMIPKLTQRINDDKAQDFSDEFASINNKLDNVFAKTASHDAKFMNIPTSDQLKDATANICKSFDSKLKESSNDNRLSRNDTTLLDNNLLDWTMRNDSIFEIDSSQRPSIIVKQTVYEGIMDILKASEEATWKSIDALRDVMKDQNDMINSIERSQQNMIEFLQDLQASGNLPIARDCTNPIEVPAHKPKKNKKTSKKVQKSLSTASSDKQPESVLAPTSDSQPNETVDLTGSDDSQSIAPVTINNSTNNTGWTKVTRKTKALPLQRNSTDQPAAQHQKKTTLFWSKLDKNFNAFDAINFLRTKNIVKGNEIYITLLTKNPNSTYLSYKIEADTATCKRISRCSELPPGSYIRYFSDKKKTPQRAELARNNKNFL